MASPQCEWEGTSGRRGSPPGPQKFRRGLLRASTPRLAVRGCRAGSSRTKVRLAIAGYRELDWEAARREHSVLHMLAQLADVRVARRQFQPRVADADDGPGRRFKVAGVDTVRKCRATPGWRVRDAHG